MKSGRLKIWIIGVVCNNSLAYLFLSLKCKSGIYLNNQNYTGNLYRLHNDRQNKLWFTDCAQSLLFIYKIFELLSHEEV